MRKPSVAGTRSRRWARPAAPTARELGMRRRAKATLGRAQRGERDQQVRLRSQ